MDQMHHRRPRRWDRQPMRSERPLAEDDRMPNRRSEPSWDDELTLLIERGRDREAVELASHRLPAGESSERLLHHVTEAADDGPVENAG